MFLLCILTIFLFIEFGEFINEIPLRKQRKKNVEENSQ